MLDKLQKDYPIVFSEPTYSIWEHRQLFQIPLIDSSKQPAHHCLLPLSGDKLPVLKKRINKQLELGRAVPLANPYWYPVQFTKKKSWGDSRLCANYLALNANMVTDAWPLQHIDDLLS